MQQSLNVDITVQIPNDYVLVKKIEYEELKESSLQGVYWTMAELENRTRKKQLWIKENILYPPRFKKVLDVQQGGFVYYPNSQGEKWTFQASKMSQFLEDNFRSIFGEVSK